MHPHLLPLLLQYKAVAEQVQEIFRDYDPHFRAMSLDEAYMDITDYVDAYVASKQNGTSLEEALEAVRSNPSQQPRDFTAEQIAHRQQCAEAIVNEMRARIFERTRKACPRCMCDRDVCLT